ncbi:hypothetical protein RTBOTA2_004894 [Rhodotorula toruloides]|nr:hypothetical protein RTBOTA2_004894 [Rhodotorula toruloides]
MVLSRPFTPSGGSPYATQDLAKHCESRVWQHTELELLHEKTLDRFSLSTSTRRARQDGWSVKDRRSSSLSLVSNTKRKVVLVVSRDRLARSLSPHPSSASTSTSLVDSLVSLLTVSLNSLGSLDSAVKNFATRLSFRKTRESGLDSFTRGKRSSSSFAPTKRKVSNSLSSPNARSASTPSSTKSEELRSG